MTSGPLLPQGFAAVPGKRATLFADKRWLELLAGRGLSSPEGWQRQLGSAAGRSGRGATGRLETSSGALVLKQMRRGGALAALWRDRYPGKARLLDNLIVPLAVARRGIATAEPVALLLAPGPPGLYRGWLATRLIEGAEDLVRCFRSATPPDVSQLGTVVALVKRMHDAGIEHPDLNLGNLLLRQGTSGPEAFVVDLDRVRLFDEPLSFGRRQRALRRLERSFLKLFAGGGDSPDWYELYAEGEPALSADFRRGQPVGRLLQRLHRLGWRG